MGVMLLIYNPRTCLKKGLKMNKKTIPFPDIPITVLNNDVLDMVLPFLNGSHVKVYLALNRFKNKKTRKLYLPTRIARKLTGLNFKSIQTALEDLEKWGIIELVKIGKGKAGSTFKVLRAKDISQDKLSALKTKALKKKPNIEKHQI